MRSGKHLSDAEIEEMIAPYTKERLWNSEQATQNLKQIQQYRIKQPILARILLKVAKNIQEDDNKARKHY